MEFGYKILGLLLACLLFSPHAAAEPETRKQVLTLQDCLQIAQEQNPEIQVNTQVEKMAREQEKIAHGAFYPTVSASASYTRADATATLPVLPGAFLFTEAGSQNNFLIGATAIQPIYDGTIFASKKIANKQKKLAHYNKEVGDKKAVGRIKKLFYATLFFKEASEAKKEFQQSTSQEFAQVKGSYDRGTASALEVLQAEGADAATESSYQETFMDYERSKDELKRLIGYPIDEEVIFQGDLDQSVSEWQGSASATSTADGEKRSEQKYADAQYQLAKAATGEKISEFFPRLYGHFSLYLTRPDLLVETGSDFGLHYWTGAALQVPIFNGLRNIHELRKAKAQEKIAWLFKQEADRQEEIRQRAEQREPSEAGTQLDGPRKTYRAQEKAFQVAQVAYQNRFSSRGSWVQAQKNWAEARIHYAHSLLQYLDEKVDNEVGETTTIPTLIRQ